MVSSLRFFHSSSIVSDLSSQIPKPNEEEGLGIGWKTTDPGMDKLKALYEDIKSKM